ncbi:HAD superfamily hydrolase (TIGR01450 family) [Knoellia remsis]|uniref:HAD superfamily hydrolase (TIGR01450 family) n=1 Tax=Knoellia remsis TaxID=407159 RepID=A0A2T0V0U3_9MICO|nr:HAD-IIA family hydrolase [Knoellia remsis]PRY63810.1 HAD superfamily hydrolase (TIGR01450 family) [Knoellia remsis]
MRLSERYDAIVCDLDGVVYRGEPAVPYAVESLAGAGLPVQFATNNASRTPGDVAAHLRRLGLDVQDGDVATSSQAAAWVLERHVQAGARVLAVGGDGVAAALRERGYVPVHSVADDPAAVVQGYGAQVTATDLAQAAYAIQRGALWVATNTDHTLPTADGEAPGNGALVLAVGAAVGRGPEVVAGKPDEPLYLMCAERLGVPPERVLAIGDRLETDIEGAHSAGMDSLFVLTGVHGIADAVLAPPQCRPTYVARDLRALDAPVEELARVSTALRAEWERRDRGEDSENLPSDLAQLVT